jgi:hypothetical protein
MIDYEKLKVAHELINKIDEIYEVSVQHHFSHTRGDKFILWTKNGVAQFGIEEMDDLIAELKELTKPEEPKSRFHVGQEIWFINSYDKICSFCIDKICKETGEETYYYNKYNQAVGERDGLYSTKQELIEAQIQYWCEIKRKHIFEEPNNITFNISERYTEGFNRDYALSPEGQEKIRQGLKELALIEENATECQHESQTPGRKDNVQMCTKCGEFYK